MPNPKPSEDFRNVSIMARGSVLAAIEARADERQLSLGKATASLIEDALASLVDEAVAPAGPVVREQAVAVHLTTVPIERLTDEIARRLADAAPAAERDAALARAVAAEGQLATVRQQLGTLLAVAS